MAKSDKDSMLKHLESTNQGHKISDILSVLKAFGFMDTGRKAGKDSIFENGDISVSLLVRDKHAHASHDMQSKVIEACNRVVDIDANKENQKTALLKEVLQKESALIEKLENDYGVEVSVKLETGKIILESKECGLMEVINHRPQPFDLEKEINSFTNELDEILSVRLDKLAELQEKSDRFIENNGKDTLFFGVEKVSIVYFGAGFPTKDSLNNAQATYERSLQPKSQPAQAIIVPEPEKGMPQPTIPAIALASTPKITPPKPLDHTRIITGGGLLNVHIEAKQRMWDTLKSILNMPHDNVFIPTISEELRMRESAIKDFFDPKYKLSPQRKDRASIKQATEKVHDFIKEAVTDGKISQKEATQFRKDFKEIKGQIETAKEQWGRG